MNKVVSIISICFLIFPCLPVRCGFIGRYNNAGNFEKLTMNVTYIFIMLTRYLYKSYDILYSFWIIYLVKNRYYGRHHEPYNSGYRINYKVSPWESNSIGRQDEDEFWDEHEQNMKNKYRNRVKGNVFKNEKNFRSS